MTEAKPVCELCGEAMPDGEEMFNYHGYSGPCPKPMKVIEQLPPVSAGRFNELWKQFGGAFEGTRAVVHTADLPEVLSKIIGAVNAVSA